MFTDEVLEVNYCNKFEVVPFIAASVLSFHQTKQKTKPTHLISAFCQSQCCSRLKQCAQHCGILQCDCCIIQNEIAT